MRIVVFDLETTGLDNKKDRIIEIAWVTVDESYRPLKIESHLLYANDYPPQSYAESEITDDMLREHGEAPSHVLAKFHSVAAKADYVCGQNIKSFDWPFYREEFKKLCGDYPTISPQMIDTLVDIPYPKKIKARALSYLAADHGFLNPFPHRALFDVFTTLKVMSFYKIADIEAHMAIADRFITIEFPFFGYDWLRDAIKKDGLRFYWEATKKVWFKRVKVTEVDEVMAKLKSLPFPRNKNEVSISILSAL